MRFLWFRNVNRNSFFLLTVALLLNLLTTSSLLAIPYPYLLKRETGSIPHPLTYEPVADSSHSFDVLRMDIDLVIDVPNRQFSGNVLFHITPESDTLTTLQFQHISNQDDICRLNGQIIEPIRDGENLFLELPFQVTVSETLEVSIAYTGILESSNFGGGMVYHEPQDVVYTFGEPYLTRKWLPCYDLPFDKVLSSVRVRLDSRYSVLSNGQFVERSDFEDGTSSTYWENPDPIATYLISIAAAEYTVIESTPAGIGNASVHFWVYPADSALAAEEFGRTSEMIDYFETLFGPYGFNKYDQAMAPIFNGWGAMEHQTCTTYGNHLIDVGERTYEGIVAHELSHQWWGDLVTPLTFAHIWLNEGFASYADALWGEHLSDERFLEIMNGFRERYFAEDDDPDRGRFPIFNPVHYPYPAEFDPMFSSTIYLKGAWVLHMLRLVTGDSLFFEGLQEYRNRYQGSNSTIFEFRQAMEDISGIDLSDFFDQWIFQAGYPQYQFENFSVVQEGGGSRATLEVTQVQDQAPFFSVPLPFRLYNEIEDTVIIAPVDAVQQQVITLGVFPFQPTGYQFDPDEWILCGNHRTSVPGGRMILSPAIFSLSPAWPNPFNGTTRFAIDLNANTRATIEIYSLLGKKIINLQEGFLTSGHHSFTWTPNSNLTGSGIYFLRVTTPGEVRTKRLIFVK